MLEDRMYCEYNVWWRGFIYIYFFKYSKLQNVQPLNVYNYVSLFLCKDFFIKQIKANFINILSCLKSNEQCLDI